jgi:hypothetical protein
VGARIPFVWGGALYIQQITAQYAQHTATNRIQRRARSLALCEAIVSEALKIL